MRQIVEINNTLLRGVSVVVTGGAGYVGSVLVSQLLRRGALVTVIDRFLYGDDSIKPLINDGSLRIIEADIRSDFDVMERVCRGAFSIVHLAAIVGDSTCAADERLAWSTNHFGTSVVHDMAVRRCVPLAVLASTCSVYGAQDLLLTEDSATQPLSVYAASKLAAERKFLTPGNYNTKCVVLRFGTLFGPSPRHRFDLVVNRLTAMAVKENRITVFGPRQWRPFLHVKDAVGAIISVIEAHARLSKITLFNIVGKSPNWTLGEMAKLVQAEIPSAEIIYSDRDADVRNYRVSDKRIRRKIGFCPAHQLRHGIAEIAEAVREAGLDYRDLKFNNAESLELQAGMH